MFGGLGDSTNPEPAENGGNWFKIGFRKEWEARRAVRRNGEIVHGDDGQAYMIGVKWAVCFARSCYRNTTMTDRNMGLGSYARYVSFDAY